MSQRPPATVLDAFGVGPEAVELPGGQGTSWLAGDVVLKPSGGPVHQWLGEVLTGLALDDVRVGVPVTSLGGAWTVDGWSATSVVAGVEPDLTSPSSWSAILNAGRAFHRAVSHLRRPAFVDAREDPWAVADRVAWGERPMRFVPELADVAARLLAQADPPGEPQVVHGDLTRNVLLAPGQPAAVIDVSPYWRPASFAEGVVVADVLCYHRTSDDPLPDLGVPDAATARALLFRLATTNVFATSGVTGVDLADEARRFEQAALALGV